ncbi:MoxR family ATPase [Hyphobacterium sp. CCMP332]|jgi:MoxR-like ATPase|uniref:AAA family ATPase n=1 Tax=Hyphobacterium sp. CCMP332 TaxID=2749086 RepID=UPI00164FC2F2|nr:MoxR family ATPase [Hyphobacterium sp. CCMP332]QNL19615.1 MoxR family ATPase [Hyphobacterium sp. CCMP332]
MTDFTLDDFATGAEALRQEIRKTVHGQDAVINQLLVSVFSRGHCLLEGPPGTAKTLLARSFAAAMALDFGRIQFTPDLMPGDVLGANLFDFGANAFRLVKGPVFTDILLADEINRAPPKTQAALLQAMQEGIVTIDGQDMSLGEHFHVIATQNPIEQQGTYPLPEAQNDRFLFKIVLNFPDRDAELEILRRHAAQSLNKSRQTDRIEPVMSGEQLTAAQGLIDSIRLDEKILTYIVDLVRETRSDPDIREGASTRAADAIAGAVRVTAALDGRDYAIPDDVRDLFLPALRHRIVLGPSAEIEGRTADDVLTSVLGRIEVPR